MAKHHLAFNLTFCCMICFCSGNFETVSEIQQSPSVEDYIDNISAHYKNEIQIVEAQLTQMEYAFQKQLSVIEYNQELVSKNSRQLESRIRSTATLNFKAKLCIQNSISNVTTESVNTQTKLRACVDTARTNSKPLANNIRTQIQNARIQLQELVKTDVVFCRKNSGNNNQKLTDCAREKLKFRETNIQNMLKVAETEIDTCMCKSDLLALTAQECSFLVILNVYTLLSEIVSNINTCIGERFLEIK